MRHTGFADRIPFASTPGSGIFTKGKPRRPGNGFGTRRGAGQLNQVGDGSGPAGLMARADTRTIVAVEEFVEQDTVAPVRIVLELVCAPEHRPAATLVSKERARKPAP